MIHVQSCKMASSSCETVCGIKIVKKRNTKSKAWLYFGLRANEDGEIIEEEQHQPICRKCGVVIRAKEGNTSNLFQHLRDHHPEMLASISTGTSSSSSESRTMTQRTIKESLARSTKYPRGSPQAKVPLHIILPKMLSHYIR